MAPDTNPASLWYLEPIASLATIQGAVTWVGAVSFEDRCTASLERLRRGGARVAHVLAIEYDTAVYPADEAAIKRGELRSIIRENARRLTSEWSSIELPPYAYLSIENLMDRVAALSGGNTTLVFDITCLTKIHAIALAAMLPTFWSQPMIIAYTAPENYSHPEQQKLAWRDIIIAPVAKSASLFNEVNSRGIVITGLEAARLVVSFAEMEPSGGLILFPETDLRPDFATLNRRKNRRLIAQLSLGDGGSWRSESIKVSDLERIKIAIHQEITIAQRYNAPIFLFPSGPKGLVFATALMLSQCYREGSWFVYPIPSFYALDYTEGSGATMWWRVVAGKGDLCNASAVEK